MFDYGQAVLVDYARMRDAAEDSSGNIFGDTVAIGPWTVDTTAFRTYPTQR